MDYGAVLTRALRIAWHHKWLWLLALLAGETSGGASFNYRYGSTGPSGLPAPGGRAPAPPDLGAASDWARDNLGEILLVLVGALVAAVVILLVLLVLSVIAQGSVVRGAAALDAGYASGLGVAWRAGVQVFWPVLGLRALGALIGMGALLLLLAIVSAAVVAGVIARSVGLVVLLAWQGLGLLLVLVPFSIAVTVAFRLAVRAVALDGAGPIVGLRAGIRMLRLRLGSVAVLWLIELAFSFGTGIVMFLLFLMLLAPAALAGMAAGAAHALAALALVGLWALLAVAVLIVVAAAVSAFFSCYWTVAYRRLSAAG